MSLRVIMIALVAVFAVGCKTGPSFDARQPAAVPQGVGSLTNFVSGAALRTFDSQWLRAPSEPFTLGPGDRLEIEVLGDRESRAITTIGPDGKLYYQWLPGMDVWGLTLAQTKPLLERELAKYIRGEPQVSLVLRAAESKRVWLLGRLSAPGVYPLAGPTTLLESLALAGGPAPVGTTSSLGSGGAALTISLAGVTEESADLRRSFVIRQGQLLPVDFYRLLRQGDLSQNIYLQPDDFVYLPPATIGNVYVLGAVGGPRAINYYENMTLVSAVAGAGGIILDAHTTGVAVVRGGLTEPKIAIVNLYKIMHGAERDVQLEPGDIVYVPSVPYQVLSRYVDLILSTFVRTVAANEGARFTTPSAAPVGIAVPINVGR